MLAYRWDLDRTYLDTDIHSVRGMIRSAFESADAKRTIPGATPLLRGLLEHDPNAGLDILSGSPLQMRDVLERKLQLDGIRFDRLVLKDNLRNLRRGRFRALREQLGYKLPQLLELRTELPTEAREILFGDDAEIDALVYVLFGDAVAGRTDVGTVAEVMRTSGAYPDQIERTCRRLEAVPRARAVDAVFIHVERGVPLDAFDHLGPAVHPVYSWFQAALVLHARGRLSANHVGAVGQACLSARGWTSVGLIALAQDTVRRGLAAGEDVCNVFRQADDLAASSDAVERAIELLGPWRRTRPPEDRRDYFAYLQVATGTQKRRAP